MTESNRHVHQGQRPGPSPSVTLFIELLASGGAEDRRHAARQLGRFGKQAELAVPALEQALGDKEPCVRETVVEALKAIRPANADGEPERGRVRQALAALWNALRFPAV
jgi:HEAT repeat protein